MFNPCSLPLFSQVPKETQGRLDRRALREPQELLEALDSLALKVLFYLHLHLYLHPTPLPMSVPLPDHTQTESALLHVYR